MMLRFIFPYLVLLLIVAGYLYYRRFKLGPVLLKVNRVLLSRYNLDSMLLVIIIAVATYFLARLELQSGYSPGETPVFGEYTYGVFYAVLLLAIIAREIEKPALREKGISSSRGFWKWEEIESFRWSKAVLTINVARGQRKRAETWLLNESDKKAVDQSLKRFVPKRQGRSKKKG